LPRFQEHLELHRIDCQASHGDLTSYYFTRNKLEATPTENIRPTPLVTGRDLIAAGYIPGPRFKQILSSVEDSQLEGTLVSKEQALEFVARNFPV
jgi:poly(A) polymerase